MYKSEQQYINENLLPAHTHKQHFFGYSQEIITKISSLHTRLHPTPLKMKMDCGRSQVRSSGPATFVVKISHGIISTAIISLALIQIGQLSSTGEKMCT